MNPYKHALECGFSAREAVVMIVVPLVTAAAPIVYALATHVDTQRPYESAMAIGASVAIGLATGAAGFVGGLVGCAIHTTIKLGNKGIEDKL